MNERKPMAEYIAKKLAIELMHQSSYLSDGDLLEVNGNLAKARIEAEPAANVVPVRHGKWLPIVSYNNTYKCSECGRLLVNITDGLKMVAKHYPYCHCGAKIDS